jgi:hypothetical protein
LANPLPMLLATFFTVIGLSNVFTLPSGSFTEVMSGFWLRKPMLEYTWAGCFANFAYQVGRNTQNSDSRNVGLCFRSVESDHLFSSIKGFVSLRRSRRDLVAGLQSIRIRPPPKQMGT